MPAFVKQPVAAPDLPGSLQIVAETLLTVPDGASPHVFPMIPDHTTVRFISKPPSHMIDGFLS